MHRTSPRAGRRSSDRVSRAMPVTAMTSTRASFREGLRRKNRKSSRGVKTTGRAHRKPALDRLVYLTPKVVAVYTQKRAAPVARAVLRVAALGWRIRGRKHRPPTAKASRNRMALRLNTPTSVRARSVRR